MELIGQIREIKHTTQISENFKKRELILSTVEQYPQHILIEFTGDRCSDLDGFAEKENVKIQINIRGREYVNDKKETQYFNSIQGWKIEKLK